MLVWIAIFIALIFGAVSTYGWWFHFTVGPAHGAGAEIGVVAGVLTLVGIGLAVWADRRRTLRKRGARPH